MFASPNQSRRATAARVLVALLGATGALAAVAYATSTPPGPGAGGSHPQVVGAGTALLRPGPVAPRPARPRITRHPGKTTLSTTAVFRYVSRQPQAVFQCKLDSAGWKSCGPRVRYRGLGVGAHRFLVRIQGPSGARGLPARYDWSQGEVKDFSIAADLSGLGRLYPGVAPVQLPLILTNPNASRILVTELRVAVAADPPGCGSRENLQLIQAGTSKAKPLAIPAGASVRLPAAGVAAPAIALRDLPVNQDACQGASFPLVFSGKAHG